MNVMQPPVQQHVGWGSNEHAMQQQQLATSPSGSGSTDHMSPGKGSKGAHPRSFRSSRQASPRHTTMALVADPSDHSPPRRTHAQRKTSRTSRASSSEVSPPWLEARVWDMHSLLTPVRVISPPGSQHLHCRQSLSLLARLARPRNNQTNLSMVRERQLQGGSSRADHSNNGLDPTPSCSRDPAITHSSDTNARSPMSCRDNQCPLTGKTSAPPSRLSETLKPRRTAATCRRKGARAPKATRTTAASPRRYVSPVITAT